MHVFASLYYICKCKFWFTEINVYLCEKLRKMEEKLRRLMKHEGINSSRLAEILEIQASGISHIMSGRNKPSFDFVTKLLARFPQINPDWLLLDKGPMYRDEIKAAAKNAATASPGNATGGSASVAAGSAGATNMATGGNLWGNAVAQEQTAAAWANTSAPGANVTTNTPWADAANRETNTTTNTPGANMAGQDRTATTFLAEPRSSQNRGMAATAQNSAVTATTGQNQVAAGKFLDPDDDDIIPGSRETSQKTPSWRVPATQTGYSGSPDNINPDGIGKNMAQHQGNYRPTENFAHTTAGCTASPTHTGAVERIVVFYKDKTFSDYRPE